MCLTFFSKSIEFVFRAIDILRGKTAQELFKINKESLVDLIGRDEGFQLYEELQVQNGAKTVCDYN